MFGRTVTAATIASLLICTSAYAYDLSKASDEHKVALLAGITTHAEMCSTPQSKTIQDLRALLSDDVDINMGDVRVKAADLAVEAALDTGWCVKTEKVFADLDKSSKPSPSTPPAPTRAVTKDGLPDYKDKSYTCDKSEIESHMASLVMSSAAGTAFGLRLIYVKGEPVETLRVSEELRCRITIKTNRSTQKGVFRYVVEDGHSLVGWAPGKSK